MAIGLGDSMTIGLGDGDACVGAGEGAPSGDAGVGLGDSCMRHIATPMMCPTRRAARICL